MKQFRILMFAAAVLAASSVLAGSLDIFELEARMKGLSTDNISKNWQEGYDKYGMAGITARFYAVPLTELSFTTEYTWYQRQVSLSNVLYRGGFRFIPTSQNSATTFFITGEFTGREYRELGQSQAGVANANQFTSDNARLMVSLGHRFTERISTRAGYELKTTTYDNPSVKDRYDNSLFAGANVSLPGSMALDLESGYDFTDFAFLPDTGIHGYYAVQAPQAYSVLDEGTLKSWFLTPRLSRSLTSRTGLSLTFGIRRFIDLNEDAIVYGNSAQRSIEGVTEGLISPWADVYEGEYYKMQVKTFDLPRVVVTGSFGFWNKHYMKTLDPVRYDETTGEWEIRPNISTYYVQDGRGDRHDYLRKANLTVTYPINMHTYYMEPSVRVDYTSSSSNIVVYDYDDLSVTMEFMVRF